MLKVWFPGTTDLQDQGLGGTEWINDNVTIIDNGKLGKCLSFNGSNSRLSTTNFELDNTWSFACWAKDDVSVTNWRILIMLNTTGSDADTQMSLWLHTGEKRFEVCANGKYVSTVKYVPSQWNHFAATYNGSQLLVYLNGVKVYTLSNTNAKLERHNLTIGARGTNANGGHTGATSYFYGLVNDLRIWDNEVLSPREMKEISKGLVVHYPLSMPGQENLLLKTNQGKTNWSWSGNGGTRTVVDDGIGVKMTSTVAAYSGSWSVLTYNDNNLRNIIQADTDYVISFDVKPNITFDFSGIGLKNGNGTDEIFTTYNYNKRCKINQWTHFVIPKKTKEVLPTISNQLIYITGFPINVGNEICLKNLKIEKGTIATSWIPNPTDAEYSALGFNDGIEYDVSGYNHNGTKAGTLTYDADTPRYNTSTVFDGITHIINNTSTIHLSNEFTISWWGKINTWRQVWEGMFLLQNTTALNVASGTYSIANAIHASTAGLMALTLRQGGTTYPFDHYNWTYTVGVWSHYACTYKDGVIIMYQNGVQTYTATIDNNSSGDYYYTIGKRVSNCNCQMSDFRIYNTALSADDILELYHTPETLSHNGTLLTQGEYVES